MIFGYRRGGKGFSTKNHAIRIGQVWRIFFFFSGVGGGGKAAELSRCLSPFPFSTYYFMSPASMPGLVHHPSHAYRCIHQRSISFFFVFFFL